MRSILWMGEMRSSRSRWVARLPYSCSRWGRRQGLVRSMKVTQLAMPTTSMPRGEELRVLGQGGQDHEAPIAAPVDGHPIPGDLRAGLQPEDGVLEVRHAVHAQIQFVQGGVFAAIARAAPHVGGQDGVAPAEEILKAHVKIGPDLAGRAAVDVEDARVAALRRGRLGPIVKGRDLQAVKGGEVDQFRLHKGGGRNPARSLWVICRAWPERHVHGPDVRVAVGRLQIEHQTAPRPG